MLTLIWVRGLLRRRRGRLSLSMAGIALAVGLLASIGAFLSSSKATMTSRAIATVAVDWQVAAQPGADSTAVAATVTDTAHVRVSEPVLFATATSFELDNGTTVQTTGQGRVLGIADTYRTTFPTLIRDLAGSGTGVLLFQQTAANLQAGPGDTISIGRPGLAPAQVTIDGVIDIPQADSLFQDVGAPIGAQPQAPPDNVLIVPTSTWHEIFDPVAASRPDEVSAQIHAGLDHQLPSDPAAAYVEVTGQARNLEVRLAGAGLVGDNLAATLSSARTDASYAQVLFLFLGIPGALLAGLVTAAVATSGRDRSRREHALLRTRGATRRELTQLALAEAALVGAIGGAVGLGISLIVGRLVFGTSRLGATTASAIGWSIGAFLVGLGIAAASVALPTWRDAKETTVVAARRVVGRNRDPLWMRLRIDFIALGLGLVVFYFTSRAGYNLVLAPEGVPTISISYWAFAGPAFLWIGAGLFSYRLIKLVTKRARPILGRALRPLAGGLTNTVTANLQRQRRLVARGAALVALTIGFAASTSIFNSTYRQQAEIDAILTNGADVTVTLSPGATVHPDQAAALAASPGVHHVEPIQHRFAYVGADLQDLYGVDPRTIVDAGRLQDAYFLGGSTRELIDKLVAQPDSVLVSAETVRDFQLLPGDSIILRLQDGKTKQYRDVPFHFVGVVKEFPTAPSDSFLLANAGYIAAQTGTDTVGAFLVDTGGNNITRVAEALRSGLGTTAIVTDIESSRRIIGSSLTAVDLAGLTRVELGFALALAAASTGLTLWLGLVERRRTFAIASALGASRRQLGAFVWAEAGVITIGGIVAGAAIGWALSNMLVKVLHGVFDPAPAALRVPWAYLGIVLVISLAATTVAVGAALISARRPLLELLRTI